VTDNQIMLREIAEQLIRSLQAQLSEMCAQRDAAEADRDDLNKRLESNGTS